MLSIFDDEGRGQGPFWPNPVGTRHAKPMDVVEKIKGVATGNMGMHQDVPLEDVIIESAEIVGRGCDPETDSGVVGGAGVCAVAAAFSAAVAGKGRIVLHGGLQ